MEQKEPPLVKKIFEVFCIHVKGTGEVFEMELVTSDGVPVSVFVCVECCKNLRLLMHEKHET